jgi:hypothetical protein
MLDEPRPPLTRRDLFALIGAAAGGTVMYQAMASLGHAAESNYLGPLILDGDPKGGASLTSILRGSTTNGCSRCMIRRLILWTFRLVR